MSPSVSPDIPCSRYRQPIDWFLLQLQAAEPCGDSSPKPTEPKGSTQNPFPGPQPPGNVGNGVGSGPRQRGLPEGGWHHIFPRGYPMQYGQLGMGVGGFLGWGVPPPMMGGGFGGGGGGFGGGGGGFGGGGYSNMYGMPMGMMGGHMDPMMAWYALHYGQYAQAMQNQVRLILLDPRPPPLFLLHSPLDNAIRQAECSSSCGCVCTVWPIYTSKAKSATPLPRPCKHRRYSLGWVSLLQSKHTRNSYVLRRNFEALLSTESTWSFSVISVYAHSRSFPARYTVFVKTRDRQVCKSCTLC